MAGSSGRPGIGGMTTERENKKLRHVDRQAVRTIGSYLGKYKGQLSLAMLFMIIVAAANMLAPYLSKIAIDDYIVKKNLSGLSYVLVAYIVLYAIFWVASYAGSVISHKVGHRMIADIRHDLYKHIVELPLSFFNSSRTGEIMSRLTGDVNNLSELITSGVTNLIGDFLTIIGVTVIMFAMNAKLAAIVLTIVPIIFIGIIYIGRFMRKAYGSIREISGKMNAGVEENLAGIRVVKSMSQESENKNSFEKLNMDTFKAQIKASGATALIFPFMSLTSAISTALAVLFGGLMIVNGESAITVGVIMAFISYTNRFFIPLRDISQVYGVYQNAAASAERIYKYLKLPNTIQPPKQPVKLTSPLKGEIRFDQVSFGYEPGKNILENFELELPAGQITAIVGPTGAGKSTLIRLIPRLYDVGSGAVRIDGIDVRDMDLDDIRKYVMLVPQDVFLFDDTIRENIRYGRLGASDEDVEKAALSACADDFIRKLPQDYDTQVGEGGGQLSGGQRQLIAFARAVLADRPILILDEATSSVDASTEMMIQKALDRLIKGRTVMIIAHRFTTLRRAQKVLVIENGQIAGYDTHKALLENCSLYQELYNRQWSAAENNIPV
ncbi:MAG: ABC transporter ATP-binding protein [Bacillota bacterium]|nr:ABC transporter ATP-binding protein [Bacillota bacterium]